MTQRCVTDDIDVDHDDHAVMIEFNVIRIETSHLGTFGQLWLPEKECKAYTGELPWVDNAVRLSCIPEGRYLAALDNTNTRGICYRVLNVPKRTDILIHVGNWVADRRDKTLRSDVLGCIVMGDEICDVKGQRGVSNSGQTIRWLRAYTQDEPFWLTIRWAQRVKP